MTLIQGLEKFKFFKNYFFTCSLDAFFVSKGHTSKLVKVKVFIYESDTELPEIELKSILFNFNFF